MGESANHIELVKKLTDWIILNFLEGDEGHIFVDAPDKNLQEKPPKIGKFIPDVYVNNISNNKIIVGEAKTAGDLENEHTKEQVAAFLSKCSEGKPGIFVFAVPWYLLGLAKSIIRRIQKKTLTQKVKVCVLEKLPG